MRSVNNRRTAITSGSQPRQRLMTKLVLVLALIGISVGAPAAVASENKLKQVTAAGSHAVSDAASYAVEEITVPANSDLGFGGGTIHVPTGQGPFGAIAVSPGFVSPQAAIKWYGPLLAEKGFIVLTIDTFSGQDVPDHRADQLQAALDYLTKQSEVQGKIDTSKLGVMGHSMGGGATLRVLEQNPSIKAGVALQPWHTHQDWSGVTRPVMLIGGQNDNIAAPSGHAIPFYKNIPKSTPKAYLELKGANHFVPISEEPTIAKYTVAWMTRFMNDDQSQDELCPPPAPNEAISKYMANCPYN